MVAALLATLLLMPALAAQRAWADEGVLVAASGELQAQAQKFDSMSVPGGVRLSYTGTAKSLSIPKTYKGQKVVEVFVDNRGLTKLDVSKATYLTYLVCFDNKITKLDVSKNKKLEYLDCSGNRLTKLDVSKNTKLMFLNCSGNKIAKLVISKNKEMRALACSGNMFKSSTKAKLKKWGKVEGHNLTM